MIPNMCIRCFALDKRTPDTFPTKSNVHGKFQESADEQIAERNNYVNEDARQDLGSDNKGHTAHTYCIIQPAARESHAYDSLDSMINR
jgi:hypothetical protein